MMKHTRHLKGIYTALGMVSATLVLFGNGANAELTTRAVWSAPENSITKDVAWGDWDGDGDLDLAVCNSRPSYQIRRNDGGTLILAWELDLDGRCSSISWGDWDGDGDLDLLAGTGSFEGSFRVIDNDGFGGMSVAWDQPGANAAQAAWADWDGDGDLDVAVATYPARIYRNDGRSFTLAWESSGQNTGALAWGDYDGDDDFDLALGNSKEFADPGMVVVYENDGAATPGMSLMWSSVESEGLRRSVAWGDWDGDDDLDLAVASSGSVRIYRNDGADFLLAWSDPEADAQDVRDVAWGDWDGDGDLDLAIAVYEGASGERWPSRLYENEGGSPPTMRLAWETEELDALNALAWGDWNGDGDEDLAVANAGPGGAVGGPIRVYSNTTFSLADLTRISKLTVVKTPALEGVYFEWIDDPAALQYHVNGVSFKTDLVSPRPHRSPGGGVGVPVCDAFPPDSTCSDDDAVIEADALIFYQVFSACGPGGDLEGPGFRRGGPPHVRGELLPQR